MRCVIQQSARHIQDDSWSVSLRVGKIGTLVLLIILSVLAILIVVDGPSRFHSRAFSSSTGTSPMEDRPGCGFDYGPCASTVRLAVEASDVHEKSILLIVLGGAFGGLAIGLVRSGPDRRPTGRSQQTR